MFIAGRRFCECDCALDALRYHFGYENDN
jgi:hypothetical protein